ncbi:hypothetical protein Bca4012_058737 [Brassica carinata]
MSLDSTSEGSTEATFDIRGIPANCVCGIATTIFTAYTVKNLGRLFYRCLTRRKHHLFKWVEDAFLEEVEEIAKEKLDVEDLKGMITELMEEVVRTKTELKRCELKMKIVCVIISLISIAIRKYYLLTLVPSNFEITKTIVPIPTHLSLVVHVWLIPISLTLVAVLILAVLIFVAVPGLVVTVGTEIHTVNFR